MDKFAKLIDGQLIPAPREITRNGYTTLNPKPEMLQEMGYKEVLYDDPPEAPVLDPAEVGAEHPAEGTFREVYTEEADCIRVGWEACATGPEPALGYEQRVEALIRERYTVSDELALLRQREAKAAEFEEYYAFCEQCKALAK